MKLNYKRTILVGFAFFLICAFWQAYDTIVPKILTDKFGMTQTLSGIVMALDNILALVLLPLFGSLSDKCKHKSGRRTPYILVGTLIAVVAFIGLAGMDYAQLNVNIKRVTDINTMSLSEVYEQQKDVLLENAAGETYRLSDKYTEEAFKAIPHKITHKTTSDKGVVTTYETTDEYKNYVYPALKAAAPKQIAAYQEIYENQSSGESDNWFVRNILQGSHATLKTPDGATFLLAEQYPTEEDFCMEFPQLNIEKIASDGTTSIVYTTNPDYTNYVVPARQAFVWNVTIASPLILILFIVVLLVVLIGMAIFRSPAVALMPDVTIKPLRSKANAVINLMGSAGGICVLGLGIVFATSSIGHTFMDYFGFFGAVAALMLVALVVFLLTVKEPKWSAEMEADTVRYGIEDVDDTTLQSGAKRLTKGEKISLILILGSVVLWYMGYNAVTSKYSVYASRVLDKDYNMTLIIAQAAAIVSYLPIGMLSSKIGRRKAILIGVVILTATFVVASFLNMHSPAWLMNIMFACAGIGWATINVNSFPMVVELAKGGDVGKYTGYYYAASMAAQAVTPFLSGLLMDSWGFTTLFPYAAVCVALAFVTMFFVRHGDSKPIAKIGLEGMNVDD